MSYHTVDCRNTHSICIDCRQKLRFWSKMVGCRWSYHALIDDVAWPWPDAPRAGRWAHPASLYLHSAGLGAAERLSTKSALALSLFSPIKSRANKGLNGLMAAGPGLQRQRKVVLNQQQGHARNCRMCLPSAQRQERSSLAKHADAQRVHARLHANPFACRTARQQQRQIWLVRLTGRAASSCLMSAAGLRLTGVLCDGRLGIVEEDLSCNNTEHR